VDGESVGQRQAERLERLLEQALVVALAWLEPGPVVVLGEISQELDPFGREAGERRRADSHRIPPDYSQMTAASLTGSATPLTGVRRSSVVRTSPASANVSAVARISPPRASDATRAATWTPLPL